MKFSTLRKALIFLALMIAVAVPAYAFSGTGSGTEAEPYEIKTYDQLKEIKNDPDAYYKLMANIVANDPGIFVYKDGVISDLRADIDIEAVNVWEPIDFSGSFVNGSRYYITGLYVPEDYANGGLFGTLTNATLQHIYMDFALVEADEYAGIIAGKAEGTTTISDCLVAGSVIGKTTKSMNTVGGMVGFVGKDATIIGTNSATSSSGGVSYADVTGATSYSANVGGIAGINHGTITKAIFAGKVYGTATYYDAAIGGIAGYNTGSVNNCRTEYGTAGGESTALVNDLYVGGVVGLNKGTVEYNINGVAVSAKNYSSGDSIVAAGGVVGATIDADISENKNTGAVTGEYAYAGGIAGVAVSDSGEMTVSACDNTGAVTSTYGVAGGIVGRAVAAGEGYVSIKLFVQDCNNTGTLAGNATGEVAGETANVESASVTIGAENSTCSGTCTAGYASVITADEVQYGSKVTASVSPTLGAIRSSQIGDTERWVIRYYSKNNSSEGIVYIAPKPVMVTLVTVTDVNTLEIISVDTTALSISGTTLSGTVKVKVYKPTTFTGGTAVTGFSAGKKYAATDFTELKAVSEGRVEEFEVPVNVTVEAGATITVNALIVDTTNAMNPLCLNKEVTK